MKKTKQNLRIFRAEFLVQTTLKDQVFTKTGRIRKAVQKGVADFVKFEAHRFIDSLSVEDVIKHGTITLEEVEVEDDD